MAFLTDSIYFMISYVIVIAGGFFLANFMSNGFLWSFIKCKISRGHRILIIMHSQPRSYPAYGWVVKEKMYYYDRETKKNDKNKTAKSIVIQDGMFTHTFGVWMAEIDEKTGNVIMPGKDAGQSFDSYLQENLIIQALQRPTDTKSLLIVILLIGVIVLALVAVGLGYMNYQSIKSIQPALSQMAGVINTTIRGVPIA